MTNVEKLEGEKTVSEQEATNNPTLEDKIKELEAQLTAKNDEIKSIKKLNDGEVESSGKEEVVTEDDKLSKLVKKAVEETNAKNKIASIRSDLSESHRLMFDGLISNGKTADEAMASIKELTGGETSHTNVTNTLLVKDFSDMRNESGKTGKKFNEAFLKYKNSRKEYIV